MSDKRPGRPPMPIPDFPENVARAILGTQPKRDQDWRYIKGAPVQGRLTTCPTYPRRSCAAAARSSRNFSARKAGVT